MNKLSATKAVDNSHCIHTHYPSFHTMLPLYTMDVSGQSRGITLDKCFINVMELVNYPAFYSTTGLVLLYQWTIQLAHSLHNLLQFLLCSTIKHLIDRSWTTDHQSVWTVDVYRHPAAAVFGTKYIGHPTVSSSRTVVKIAVVQLLISDY